MPPLAYSALTAVIFTSAAGALLMCLLVFKYGFAPDPDELPSAAMRRVFITRLGHAVAGTSFAVSAILAAVTLTDLTSVAPPVAGAGDRLATDERIAGLTSRMSTTESRLQRADELMRRVEARLQKLDSARVAAPSPSVEPVSPAPPKPAEPVVRADPPPTTTFAERRVPARAVKPIEPAVRVDAPQPKGFSAPRPVAPVAKPPRTPARDDLGSRLRRDWEEVKRGFATAGSDFRAAVDEQARSVRRIND